MGPLCTRVVVSLRNIPLGKTSQPSENVFPPPNVCVCVWPNVIEGYSQLSGHSRF